MKQMIIQIINSQTVINKNCLVKKMRSSTNVVWSQKVAFMLYSERVKNLRKRGDRGCLLDRENPGARALTELVVFRELSRLVWLELSGQ